MGFYEHGNESSGSIKGREFLDWLTVVSFSIICHDQAVSTPTSYLGGPWFKSQPEDWLF
jgi:hypothetical protein